MCSFCVILPRLLVRCRCSSTGQPLHFTVDNFGIVQMECDNRDLNSVVWAFANWPLSDCTNVKMVISRSHITHEYVQEYLISNYLTQIRFIRHSTFIEPAHRRFGVYSKWKCHIGRTVISVDMIIADQSSNGDLVALYSLITQQITTLITLTFGWFNLACGIRE